VGKKWVKSIEQFKAAIKAESVQKGVLLLIRVPHPNGAQAFMVLQSS